MPFIQPFLETFLFVLDEAIQWYKEKLGFSLIEDIDQGRKRWVRQSF
jgi:hypothetical protein